MCKPCISTGLHTVTQQEIHASDKQRHVQDWRRERRGYWPREKTNAQLRDTLCIGCDPSVCEVRCAFGREAERRINAGIMPKCRRIRRKETQS